MADSYKESAFAGQELIKFSISAGGGKRGTTDSTVFSAYGDGRAMLVFSKTDARGQEPCVERYMTDGAFLAEIKNIFLECGMYGWQGKKFSGKLIADGASVRYGFVFTEGDVSFSAQRYPQECLEGLDRLKAAIERAKEALK